jgi:hypothetical protein
LRLEVGTFGRRNTCRVILHLRSNPGAATDLRTLEVPAHALRDGHALLFRFEPIRDSANRWFYFVADSPDAAPGDAVTFWATPSSDLNGGQRYEDGLPAAGSLVLGFEFNGVTG